MFDIEEAIKAFKFSSRRHILIKKKFELVMNPTPEGGGLSVAFHVRLIIQTRYRPRQ
jgi:hypothetical protein